jgi:hypothetical protein
MRAAKAHPAERGVLTEAMTPAAFKNFIAAETECGKVFKLAKIAVH